MIAARRGRTGSAPAAGFALALFALASAARADEGPLRNQAFVPVDERAAEALDRGDRELSTTPEAAADAWFEALAGSETGAAVPLRAVEDQATSRAFEGVEEAVLRRLADPRARRAWTARFEALGAERLGDGSGPAPLLARVERRFPATPAAFRAALILGDRALARGERTSAGTWYGRAAAHARLGAGDPTAPERRLALAASLAPRPTVQSADGAPRALAPIALQDPRGPGPSLPTAPRGSGLTAGLAVVDEGEVVVQTASRVHLIDLEQAAVTALFEPGALIPAGIDSPSAAWATREAPAWSLTPSVLGRRLVLVEGRRAPGGSTGNVLLCVELPEPPVPNLERGPVQGTPNADRPPPLARFGESAAPDLRWALDAEGRAGNAFEGLRRDVGLTPGSEFQPGPVQSVDRVVVAVRSGEEELATRLLAVDARDGRPLWERLLVVGTELTPGQSRLRFQSGASAATTPLTWVGSAVFVGSQTGAGSLLDAVDGRLRWTVLNRRRSEDDRGWTGRRAAAFPDGRSVVWAPADSDRLYWLPAGPLREGPQGPFLAPPAPIDAAFGLGGVLLDGARPLAVLTADAGPRQALVGHELDTGRRFEALHLFPGEPLRDGLAVAVDRVLGCSDRAFYAFEPARELLLLHRVALPSRGFVESSRWSRGGDVRRVGPYALILESGLLTIVALR